ncbi:probable methyltransferase PMT26 [Asparagus officinalis]|uniref:probable methyltransferase PMT26 n=1 Tax=Asparagus officinalis TaxID=4686 RepID=UPI00098DEE13|nr:probable methyltransferase PMT26 [Asparagus officinalis]
MPFGRNQRLDPRRSSPYCSTTTIVVLVALCLVGVWMMTSSTVAPVDMSSSDDNSEVKQQVSETDGKPFEDNNGEVPIEASEGDTNTNSNSGASESQSESSQNKVEQGETTGNVGGTTQDENSSNGNKDTKDESIDTSKSGTYSDANGKLDEVALVKEGGDSKSESRDKNTRGEEVRPEKSMEKNSVETESSSSNNSDQTENSEQENSTVSTEQEKTAEQNYHRTGNNVKEKNTEQTDQTQSNDQNKSTEEKSDKTASNEQQLSDTQNSNQESKSDVVIVKDKKGEEQIDEKMVQNQNRDTAQKPDEGKTEDETKEQGAKELLPSGAQAELLNETITQNVAWSTQASESKNEKEKQATSSSKKEGISYSWKLCNVTAGPDYIPCLDNEAAIKKLPSTKHYEHRERHCPEEAPTCLVPLPDGYKKSIEWPNSRDKIWYHNVPHTKLAVVKGHQNWVKVSGEYLTFPGGGTQFKHGALHYIDVIQEALPDIAWGKRSRVVLDVGCGVASFGGYIFERDVLTMSFAPKDEHEAQVQFALERGIPAISAVMGTKRLPFPGRVFDVVHCARCRVPWHIEGGTLLLELNRLLRPGGYFVWSATPVYQKLAEDVEIWKAMTALMKSMCWDMVAKTKDNVDRVGLAIFRKPSNNSCYEHRKQSSPPFCQESDDPNAAWNVPLQTCMHKIPVDASVRGSKWPEKWPLRLETAPYWLNSSQIGVYGKAAPEDFKADQEHWNTVVSKSYLNGMGIDWSKVRNVMDMRAVYGG